jgi:hypothetical protein
MDLYPLSDIGNHINRRLACAFRLVMAGFVPAIHVLDVSRKKDVDPRHEAGHDERLLGSLLD